MPNSLTWYDLPAEISLWPALPLSLSGDEVMPLDYRAGGTGWLLYGRTLDKARITDYQHKLGAAMVIVSAWVVEGYQVVRLAGFITPLTTFLAHEAGFDVASLGNIPNLKTPGLLVMDMDSTAIQIECINEIARLAGRGEKVAEVTERAMCGELDFTTSLRQRVAMLKGVNTNILQMVRNTLPLMSGLTSLVAHLQALSWQVAIVSGGFSYYAEYLRDTLHLSAVEANKLEIRDGKLTGKLVGDIVDAQYKADMLHKLARRFKIALGQTVAVGDGANDLPMIKASALGIAYHAKPKVNEQSDVIIRHADLMGVFCILSSTLVFDER